MASNRATRALRVLSPPGPMMTSTPRETVQAFVRALDDGDFETARSLVSDDLSYVGLKRVSRGAHAYFADREGKRSSHTIHKVFVDGDDVCLLYDLTIDEATQFGCGWYHVEEGRIDSLRVVYG